MSRVCIYTFLNRSNNRYIFTEEITTPLFDWCYKNDKEIYHIYIDLQHKRQMLDELIEDAKTRKFETVIVNSIKDFGTFRKDIRDTVYTLNSYGVDVEELDRNKVA